MFCFNLEAVYRDAAAVAVLPAPLQIIFCGPLFSGLFPPLLRSLSPYLANVMGPGHAACVPLASEVKCTLRAAASTLAAFRFGEAKIAPHAVLRTS